MSTLKGTSDWCGKLNSLWDTFDSGLANRLDRQDLCTKEAQVITWAMPVPWISIRMKIGRQIWSNLRPSFPWISSFAKVASWKSKWPRSSTLSSVPFQLRLMARLISIPFAEHLSTILSSRIPWIFNLANILWLEFSYFYRWKNLVHRIWRINGGTPVTKTETKRK